MSRISVWLYKTHKKKLYNLSVSLWYLYHRVCTACMCPHFIMGFFMLLKFKQKPLDAWPQWIPRPEENEKQMRSTKSCLVWKKGSCKTLHRNNAASLWSLYDRVSIDLWIDYNCKRSNSTALPGLIAPPLPPTPAPPQGPQSGECPDALLWAPLSSSWPRISLSIHVACQKFCFVVAVVVYKRMRLGSFQLARHISLRVPSCVFLSNSEWAPKAEAYFTCGNLKKR